MKFEKTHSPTKAKHIIPQETDVPVENYLFKVSEITLEQCPHGNADWNTVISKFRCDVSHVPNVPTL